MLFSGFFSRFRCFFFFKQKTAYEMRISDWSSDVCSSDLGLGGQQLHQPLGSAGGALHVTPDFRQGADGRGADHRIEDEGAEFAARHLAGEDRLAAEDRKRVV